MRPVRRGSPHTCRHERDPRTSTFIEVKLVRPGSAGHPRSGWQSWRTIPANIRAVTGTHTVYITFSSGQPADFVNLNWFTFGS
nr:carbohydrate-binding protein [Planomonospora venezuelensis]